MTSRDILRPLYAAAIAVALIQALPSAVHAQDKQATTDQAKAQREKEMREWTQKGQNYQQEQSALYAKRKACSAQAKAQKLHFGKRRAFMKTCLGA